MSLTGALNNSVDALLAQSQALVNISNNISNSETTGYKSVDTSFSTLLSQNSTDTSAYGVTASTRNRISTQGTIVSTGNTTDLAIDGKGFFVVSTSYDGSGDIYYTRNGSLTETPASDVDSSVSSTSGLTYLTDANGDYLMGWPYSSTPTTTTNSTSGLTAIEYDQQATMAGSATSTVTLGGTVPSTTSTSGTISSTVTVYDDTGTAQSITVSLTPTGTTGEWSVDFSMSSGGTVAAPATVLDFDSDGAVTTTDPVSLGVTWSDGTTSTISVDMSSLVENASSSTLSLSKSTQDGYTSGSFSSVSIDDTGTVYENFTNGQSEAIATVAIAQFVEPDALEAESGTLFKQTAAAGALELGTATSLSGQSSIVTESLESSTVDIATQFTNMISTQQAYSAASELWGTADDMVQTVRDLVTT